MHQTTYAFPNGYGASVIRGQYAYGGYEMAVLKDDSLTYDTPITDDVVGHLNDSRCAELLEQIQALPAPLV